MDTLIAAIGELVTGLGNLLLAMNTTNQHLTNITQPNITINNTPSPNYEPNPPRTYDGNPNRVTACIQEHEMYFKLVNITNDQIKIIFILGNILGGTKGYATVTSLGRCYPISNPLSRQ